MTFQVQVTVRRKMECCFRACILLWFKAVRLFKVIKQEVTCFSTSQKRSFALKTSPSFNCLEDFYICHIKGEQLPHTCLAHQFVLSRLITVQQVEFPVRATVKFPDVKTYQQSWLIPLCILNCHNTLILLYCCLVSLWDSHPNELSV